MDKVSRVLYRTRSGEQPRTGGRTGRQDAARPGPRAPDTGGAEEREPPPGGEEPTRRKPTRCRDRYRCLTVERLMDGWGDWKKEATRGVEGGRWPAEGAHLQAKVEALGERQKQKRYWAPGHRRPYRGGSIIRRFVRENLKRGHTTEKLRTTKLNPREKKDMEEPLGIQYISDEEGNLTALIVPIALWHEIVSEQETAYLLKSEVMRQRLLQAKNRRDGIAFEVVREKLGI